MSDQSVSHCPYLGLKQHQAIRFSDPTPEHRCYAAGGAQEIPLSQADYQARYCLTVEHRRCPLYTGLVYTTTPSGRTEPEQRRGRGLRGLLDGLAAGERRTYLVLVSGVAVLLMVYVILATSWFYEQRRSGAGTLPTAAAELPTPGDSLSLPATATALLPTAAHSATPEPTTAVVTPEPTATAAPLTPTPRRPTLVLPTLTSAPLILPQLPTATALPTASPAPPANTGVVPTAEPTETAAVPSPATLDGSPTVQP